MARGLKFWIYIEEELHYPCVENKGVISFAVTAKLICVFVFTYAKCQFSHDAAQMILVSSVVPIVASYRKLVAVARNRRQSIETFHYRLSELRYGSKCFRNIWFICGWLGSSKRSYSILHLFSTYFKFNPYKIEAEKTLWT